MSFSAWGVVFGAVTTVSDGLSIETNIQRLTGDIDIYLKTLYR